MASVPSKRAVAKPDELPVEPLRVTNSKRQRKGPYMQFKTNQVEGIITLASTLKALHNNCDIVFNDKGWLITSIDNTQTVMTDLRIKESMMEGGIYECNTQYRIGVDMQSFSAYVKKGRRYELVELVLRGKNPTVLLITFTKGKKRLEMELKLNEIDQEILSIPPLEYNQSVVLVSNKFKEAVSNFKGETSIKEITLQKTPDEFQLIVETMQGRIVDTFVPDDTETEDRVTFKDQVQGKQSAVFSLQKILHFTKITKATVYVTISLSEEEGGEGTKPLKVSYVLAALGELTFYLAPKVLADN